MRCPHSLSYWYLRKWSKSVIVLFSVAVTLVHHGRIECIATRLAMRPTVGHGHRWRFGHDSRIHRRGWRGHITRGNQPRQFFLRERVLVERAVEGADVEDVREQQATTAATLRDGRYGGRDTLSTITRHSVDLR